MAPTTRDGDDRVHLTAPQPHSERGSVWPAFLGGSVVLLALGLTVFLPLALVAVVLLGVGVYRIAGEVADEEDAHKPGRPADRAAEGRWARIPRPAVLAGFLALSILMIHVAVLRTALAHGVFAPGAWPPAARVLPTMATVLATAALVVSGGLLQWGGRRATSGRGGAAFVTAVVLGALFLVGLAFEWGRVRGSDVFAGEGMTGTIYYTWTGLHALTAVGGLVASGLFGLRIRGGRLAQRREAVAGVVTYWWFVVASWLVVFALLHLRILTIGGQFLI